MTDEAHACDYTCDRPECVRRQRDELRHVLRQRLIDPNVYFESGRKRLHNVGVCDLCGGVWPHNAPERHAEGCLAA